MKFLVIRQSPTPSATGSSTTHTCSSWAGHRSEEIKLCRLKPNQPDPVTRRFAPIAFKCVGTPAQVQAERALKLVGIRTVTAQLSDKAAAGVRMAAPSLAP